MIDFPVFAFARYRVKAIPTAAFGCVLDALLFFGQLFVRDVWFHILRPFSIDIQKIPDKEMLVKGMEPAVWPPVCQKIRNGNLRTDGNVRIVACFPGVFAKKRDESLTNEKNQYKMILFFRKQAMRETMLQGHSKERRRQG